MTEIPQTQFNPEGQPAFPVANTGNDDPAPSSGEETNTNPTGGADDPKESQSQGQEGGEPGSGDPKSGLNNPTVERWQEREADWKERFNTQETRHSTEIEKLREEIGAKQEAPAQPAGAPDVPKWFGGDSDQWAEYSKTQTDLLEKAKETALAEVNAKTEAEQKAITDATTYMGEQMAEIQNDKTLNPDGLQIDQNKLLKLVLEKKIVDLEGRWNYKVGFEMMKDDEKFKIQKNLDERKKLAGASQSENRAEPTPSAFMTPKDFEDPSTHPW